MRGSGHAGFGADLSSGPHAAVAKAEIRDDARPGSQNTTWTASVNLRTYW